MDFGVLCLIPPLLVLVLAVALLKAFEPLLMGRLIGCLVIKFKEFPNNFITALPNTLKHTILSVLLFWACGYF
jgi:hypothetical protein